MKKILLSSALCASMMFAASDYNYEITPMVGGSLHESNMDLKQNMVNAGLTVGFNQDNSFIDQIEVGFLTSLSRSAYPKHANVSGKTHITRGFVNLVKDYPLTSDLSAYALAGVGAEYFSVAKHENENGFFGNYGLGLKYKITDSIALKADARHVIETDHGDNTLLYNLGLAIPFGAAAKAAPVVAPVVAGPRDSDGDGVIDAKDRCPNTPRGVKVNAYGCELDSDGDGVVDRLDQCPNTMEGAKVNSVGCITLVDLKINYKTNSAVINPSYESRLEAFAAMMNANKGLKATIEGHTDSVGKAAYNQKLSERRAASAIKALEKLNVDASRLTGVGYGETKPVASNKTKEGRAQNRRVQAVINR